MEEQEQPARLAALLGGPVSGKEAEPPTHVRAWDPTRGEYDWFTPLPGREDVLEQYRSGPDFSFTENHHTALRLNPVGDPDDPEEEAREAGMQVINARPDVREFLKGEPSRHLEAAVKNRLLEEHLASEATGGVPAALRRIVDGPNWKLVREAADCLDRLAPEPSGTRGGYLRPPDRRGYAQLLQAPDEGDGV